MPGTGTVIYAPAVVVGNGMISIVIMVPGRVVHHGMMSVIIIAPVLLGLAGRHVAIPPSCFLPFVPTGRPAVVAISVVLVVVDAVAVMIAMDIVALVFCESRCGE
jgi:hypothetical protein